MEVDRLFQDHQESHTLQSSSLQSPSEQRSGSGRSRVPTAACARCRKLKVRCEWDQSTCSRCQRCFNAKVACEKYYPQPRKRPIRVNNLNRNSSSNFALRQANRRIEELDQQVCELTNKLLHERKRNNVDHGQYNQLNVSISGVGANWVKQGSTNQSSSNNHVFGLLPGETNNRIYGRSQGDVRFGIDEILGGKLINHKQAEELYQSMKNVDFPVFKFIKEFSDGYSFEDLRFKYPTFLLASVVGGSMLSGMNEYDEMSVVLDREIGDRIFVRRDREPEILVALIIASIFVMPSKKTGFQSLMYMHLGYFLLHSIPRDIKTCWSNNEKESILQEKRLTLAVYCVLTSINIDSTRPLIAAWTKANEEFATELVENGNLGDCHLVIVCRLLALTEEVSKILSSNDILQPETLRTFAHSYTQRIQSFSREITAPTYLTEEFILYAHLFVRQAILKVLRLQKSTDNMVIECINGAIHYAMKMLELFLQLDPDKKYPSYFYWKPSQSLLALVKLSVMGKPYGITVPVETLLNKCTKLIERMSLTSLSARRFTVFHLVAEWYKARPSDNTLANDQANLTDVILAADATGVRNYWANRRIEKTDLTNASNQGSYYSADFGLDILLDDSIWPENFLLI